MKVRTSELIGPALDWAVAKAITETAGHAFNVQCTPEKYSTDWSQGGPIIEREGLDLVPGKTQWFSHCDNPWVGPTPLIAAMRCYVASKLGAEIEVPDALCTTP